MTKHLQYIWEPWRWVSAQPVWETLGRGLYEVKTCWFALIHSDGFDISRLLIPSDWRWSVVNRRILRSENPSLYEVTTSLICFPTGGCRKIVCCRIWFNSSRKTAGQFWFAPNYCQRFSFSATEVSTGKHRHEAQNIWAFLTKERLKRGWWFTNWHVFICPQDLGYWTHFLSLRCPTALGDH